MGDEVLMKKLMIVSALALNMFANTGDMTENKSDLISEYKDMFKRISQKRVGVEESKIDNLASPFIKEEKKTVIVKKGDDTAKKFVDPFLLQAIFGNRVKISGEWHKLGENVNGMKIITIKHNHVWLKNSEFRKKLTMGNKNEKISIK
jgi:hypothetical protein